MSPSPDSCSRSTRASRSSRFGVAGAASIAVVGLLSLGNACGGKASLDTPDASVADAGPVPGPRATECPAVAPTVSSACSKNDVVCEYGDAYNPLCNDIYVCSSGSWGKAIHRGTKSNCGSSSPPPIPSNAPDCAATRGDVPEGASCTSKSTCSYDGATCACGVFCPSYPVRREDCDADAGITKNCCDTTKVAWNCFDGPPYCTTPRPRVGSPCVIDSPSSCAVDEPAECGQSVLTCRKGVWSLQGGDCPVSTARAKKEITYLDEAQSKELQGELMNVRLATYRYKESDPSRHLGFIIEDMPQGSAAVLASRDRVDLYGYVSMTVASLQEQQRQLDRLEKKITRLEADNAAMKKRTGR